MSATLEVGRAALLAVIGAFDNGENRNADRQPMAAAALKQVYSVLGMPWPECGSDEDDGLENLVPAIAPV